MSDGIRAARLAALLALSGLCAPALAATYHLDKVGTAQTVCGATTATTITTATVSGTQTTLQNAISAAGDYHFRMDASGFNPTAGQEMYTPAFAACSTIAASATFSLYARASWSGTRPQWQVRLYDVDSSAACGAGTLIGQSAWTNNTPNSGVYGTTSLTIANSAYEIQAGHRIRIEVWIRALDANTTDARVRYGTNATDSFLATSESACTTTTVGNGTDPGSGSLCPGGAATDLDAFTLQTSAGTDTVTSATVSFAAGTSTGVGTVAITDDAGSTTYGSAGNPADTQAIAFGTNITATTTLTPYKVRITPRTHPAMPAPPGASYAVTGTVTSVTSGNPKSYNDSASATLTIDNLSPGNPTWGAVTPGDAQVALNWTNPGDSDFNQVVILRNTASISDAPAEGATYVQGNTIGTSVVRYAGSATSSTDTGLSNGTGYYYKVFARDNCGNYSTGVETGPQTPSAPAPQVTPGVPTATVDACNQITVSAPYTGDTDGDSTTSFSRGPSASGPWTAVCANVAGASPRSCVDGGVSGSSTYYYEVDFADPDGVSGTDPQVIGPYNTPSCVPSDTTAGTASALVSGCSQIAVTAPFTGDGDADGSVLVEYNTTNSWPGTTACSAVTGASPRMCYVTGLAASTAYYVRVTYSDPDGVSGTAVQVLPGTYTTTACAGNGAPPMVLFVAPGKNAVVGGTDRFKVQVYDPDGVLTANVLWGLDGAAPASPVTKSTSYNCNIGSQTNCGVYEFDVDTTALANGSHYATVRAADSGTPAAVGQRSWPFVVNNSGTKPRGSGYLLRRTHGSQLCLDCHNLPTHSSQATSFTYGSWGQECLSCHTPHATTNIFLIRSTIETPASGGRSVDFRNTTGKADFSFATSTVPGNGVCEVCHTKTRNTDATPRYRNSGGSDGGKHFSSSCTGCHRHAVGFAGGASGGNDVCSNCHNFGMLVTEASRTSSYHHVLEAASTLSGGVTSYPTSATPTAATGDQDKTCTQCHADHNVFRPDINTSNTLGVGANLRTRITTGPPTGNPPPPSAPGDASPGYYSNRDHDAGFTSGGVCLSCHINAQAKNSADQKSDGSTQTRAVVSSVGNFAASAHAFGVPGSITSGSSAFTVACVKCHSDGTLTTYQNGTYRFTLHASANRRLLNPLGISSPGDPLEENFCFRCHSRTSDTTPGGGPAKGTANRDYYNQVAMSGQAELIFNEFTNAASYPWDHPVQGTGGLHDAAGEGASANDGTLSGAQRHIQCEDCHNPHAAAPIASGTYSGSVSGYTTNNAPNFDVLTDGAQAWTTNALKGYTVKLTTGTQAGKSSVVYANTATTLSVEFASPPAIGDRYVIVNAGVRDTGNLVSPALKDVWGLSPTWPAQPAPPNWDDSAGVASVAEITGQYSSVATWGRTEAATVQGQVCIKCHSAFAYGGTPPDTPSGGPNSSASSWVNTAGLATAQSDIASQFNPNNLSHHAVFARGRNQPIQSGVASYYNVNWPKFIGNGGTIYVNTSGTTVTLAGTTWPTTVLPGWFLYVGSAAPAQGATGWYEVSAVTSSTQLTVDRSAGTLSNQNFMLTAGLGNNFVPPWGPWSTLSCSDCHTSSVQSDPFGPHGSAIKWLLRGGEVQSFMFYNGTGSTPTSVIAASYTPDPYHLCLNCHRRDVYGDYNYTAPTYNLYPRQEHPIDKSKNHSLTIRSGWGIVCMNCHGGARIGQIHGSNLGRGIAGTGGSNSGKRLLAGASWVAVTRSGTAASGTCWTKGSTDTVDNCGHSHAGVGFLSGATAGRATYDYDSASP